MDIEGLVITRRHEANRIETCFSKPSVSVIIQGSKRTMLGSEEYCYGENQCLVAGVDMPSSFYVTDASPERPFLALCLDLDKYLITRLAAEVPPPCATGACSYKGLSVADVDPDILHAFLRLVELLEKPEQIPILGPLIVREIHYRLLIGPQGEFLRLTEHPRHPEQSDRPSHHVAAGQLQGTVAGRQAGSEGKHGHLHVPPPF